MLWLFFFLLAHFTHRIRVEKHSSSLSELQSPVNTVLMFWQTARRLALLILDSGNKETKLGNHEAFHLNLKITKLKSIYLANALIFPLGPIIFS